MHVPGLCESCYLFMIAYSVADLQEPPYAYVSMLMSQVLIAGHTIAYLEAESILLLK